MKNWKILFTMISITFVCTITLIFNVIDKIKDTSKIQINILSALDNNKNEKLEEKLNNEFLEYKININSYTDMTAENILKTELENGANDIVIGLEKNSVDSILNILAEEKEKTISKYKNEYYKVINESKLAAVINKKYNAPKVIEYDYLLEISENNKFTLPNFNTSYESQNFCFGLKDKYGEEKAIKYLEKLNKNILKYPTNNDGMINLLNKKEMDIGILPYELACNEFENSEIYDIKEIENNSKIEETLLLIANRKNEKDILKVYEYLFNNYKEVFKYELTENNIKIYNDRKIYYNKINFDK